MAGEVRIPVQDDLDDDELLRYFDNQLSAPGAADDFDGPLSAALDLEVDDHDDRAVLDDVEVSGVEISEDGRTITIEYTVTFSAHHGCRDMNYTDMEDREIEGSREGCFWVFDEFQAPERLSPNEEL